MGKTDRITTNKLIKSAILCKDCPAKIYQKENAKIKYGKGNLSADYIFVLPINASYIEECEKYLKEVTKDKLDIDLEYITYHPKCAANSPVEGGYDKYCVHYLVHEIRKINPKAVIFCGVDIPNEIYTLSYNKFKVYKINNLLSIYYDPDKKEEFIEKLKQIL